MPEPISVWPSCGVLAEALSPELDPDAVYNSQRLRPLWTPSRHVTLITHTSLLI